MPPPMHAARADGSARLAAELPNMSLPVVRALLGDDLADGASNGPKKMAAVVGEHQLRAVLGGRPD